MRGARIVEAPARVGRSCAVLSLALAACGSPSLSSAPPPPSAPTTTTAVPAAPAAPPSPFSVFAEGWEIAVADTRGPVVIHDRLLGAMVTVDGGRVTRVERPFERVPAAVGTTGTLTGKWPEGALLTIRAEALDALWGIRGVTGFFRRSGGSWEALRGVGWSTLEGTQLHGPDDGYFDAHVAVAADGRSFVLPHPYDAKRRVFSPDESGQMQVAGATSRSSVETLEALASGDIVALGRDQEERRSVERLRPGQPGATAALLPQEPPGSGAELGDVWLCPAADDAIHLVGWSKSADFAFLTLRGATWEVSRGQIPVPPRAPLARCAIGRDGSTWLAFRARRGDPDAASALLRRSPSGAIERVPYPTLPPLARRLRFEDDPAQRGRFRVKLEELRPSGQPPGSFRGEDVFVAEDGVVWITGRRGAGDDPSVEHDGSAPFALTWRVVLRLGAPLPETPLDWGALAPRVVEARLAAYNAEGNEASALSPARTGCASFVRLGPLPAGEDFSPVRAVVKDRADLAGTVFIEARVEGVHVLGALAPDDETGKRLFALFKGHVPGARLYCGRPRVLRVIPLGMGG